jgi:DME family drug/metabolite transporter
LAAFGLVTVTLFYLVLVWTFERTSVAVGTLLLYLAPALVALGAALALGEPLTRRKLVALGLAFAGCLLVVEAYRPAELEGSAAGLAFGVLSACCYGSYSLGGKALLARLRPPTLLFYHYAFGAGGLILIKLVTAPDHLPPFEDVVLIAASVGVAVTLVPIALYTAGLRRLPAGEASILATWEPVMAIAVAVAVLGEVPSIGQAIGGVLVISGVVMLAVTGRRWVRSRRAVAGLKTGAEARKPLRG